MGAETVPAVTVKVVELAPCGMVTGEVGTMAAPLDDETVIAEPPLGAAEVSAMVQVELAVGLIVRGVQENPFNPGVWLMVTVPPVVETAMEAAIESVPRLFASWSVVEVFEVVLDSFTEAVAATPFAIVAAFMPQSMQLTPPEMGLQIMDLPAAVATGPAAMVTDATSAPAYFSVHATAEGRSVPVVASATLRGTVSPGRPLPEDRVRLTF